MPNDFIRNDSTWIKSLIGRLLELQETDKAKLSCTLLVETDEGWNLYKPSCWLAKPIIFREVESCMMH